MAIARISWSVDTRSTTSNQDSTALSRSRFGGEECVEVGVVTEAAVFSPAAAVTCGARRLGAALRFEPQHQITFVAKISPTQLQSSDLNHPLGAN